MKTNGALVPSRGMSRCGCCPLNRRAFIAKGGAAGVAALGALTLPRVFGASAAPGQIRIRIVYVLFAPVQPRPTWPNIGYDFVPVMKGLEAALAKKCPKFQFVTSMASTEEEAQKILAEDQGAKVDGYLVYQMNNWPRVAQTIAASGKPVLYADFTYGGTGGFLSYNAALLRSASPNVGFVASSELRDLVEAVKQFEIVRHGGAPSAFVAATVRLRQKRTPRPSASAYPADPVQCQPIFGVFRRAKAIEDPGHSRPERRGGR